MLKLVTPNGGVVLNTDDFYIINQLDGLDQLIFNISIYDEHYPEILEESIVEYEQPYLVKAIDAGKDTAKIKCQIDLNDLKAEMLLNYTNGSATLNNTVQGILPTGWVFIDQSGSTISRTIEGNYTPFDVLQQCTSVYGVVFRYDVKSKRINAYSLTNFEPLGAFASRELNLTEINYKGKSTDFYTRLYAYGKNGLSFASINNGLPYVENLTYSDKVICAYWQDDRYEVAANLLSDAQEMVDKAAVPERSYTCKVVDLAKTNPDIYGFQDFSLYSVVRLIDDIKQVSVNYQVVEYWDYPAYPSKNVVTLSSAPPKIQNNVKNLQTQISDTQSNFWSALKNSVQNATSLITGADGGFVVLHVDPNTGQPYEILVMDKPDIATATKVWRWNQNGFGYSENGYNGPYGTAITMDGQIVADFITAGVLSASIINGGQLTIKSDGTTGIVILDENGNVAQSWNPDGLEAVGTLTSNGTNTFTGNPTSAELKGGMLKFYENGEQTLSFSLSGTKDASGQYPPENISQTIATTWAALALGFLDNENDKANIYYYLNNGLNPNGFTERHLFNQAVRLLNGANLTRINFMPSNTSTDSSQWNQMYCSTTSVIVVSGDFNVLGTLYTASGAVSTSDRREKKSISTLDGNKAYQFIKSLIPSRYKYKKRKRWHHGFIAQDTKESMYEDWGLHIEDSDGKQGLRYEELLADMVATIQVLQKKVEKLEEEVKKK